MMISNKHQDTTFTFRRHDVIGTAGAEEDEEFLRDCFVDTGDLDIVQDPGDKRIVILGRTGSGKSALLMALEERESNVVSLLPENLALGYISNSTILKFFENLGVNLDPFFKLLWRHVLTVEILTRHFAAEPTSRGKTLVDRLKTLFPGMSLKEKKAREAIDYLTEWGETFWQETEYRVKEITKKVEHSLSLAAQAAIEVPAGDFSVGGRYADQLTQEQKTALVARGQEIISKAQVQDLSKVLDLLSETLKDRQQVYYVAIDRLDENWIEERLRFKLIMALILTAREFLKVQNAKIILALRRDLIERVFRLTRDSGFQEEKYQSLYLPLEWRKDDLLDLLDRRINLLVKSRYTKKSVHYRDLLPPKVGKQAIGEYLYFRARRPRDMISLFNACILVSEGQPQISSQALRKAEGEWSRSRFRALGTEWIADYPKLLDFAKLLEEKPASFKLRAIDLRDVENLCLDQAANHPDGQGHLQLVASQVVDLLLSPEEARKLIVRIFYKIGLVGLKLSAHQGESWVDQLGRGVSSAEITGATSIVVHPAYYRELGIRGVK